jgi:radical SAM superfamily enzyme YgiQ (UPF0313 family)
MKITLLACYEQGHQPLSLASPLALLRNAGHEAEAFDLSIQRFPTSAIIESSLVAISTPMHTALKLAKSAAERVRLVNPSAHICFYGLYAWLNADLLLTKGSGTGLKFVDSVIGGEYEAILLTLAKRLRDGRSLDSMVGLATDPGQKPQVNLQRPRLTVPDRASLPGVNQYAHLLLNGEALAAGYTEGTRGCLHHCRHCPVVPVYNGRFFVVPADIVLADIRQQVADGARHITFGDPDFLNGPGHSLRIARELHAEYPQVTYDFTTKVEHIIEHKETMRELASLGAAFVVSAFESTADHVLGRLDKGHTRADMERALSILQEIDLPVQATWVPFTPWTTLNDYLAMLAWIRDQRLVQNVAAVQLSIRLLVPPGSALLDHNDRDQWVGTLDEEAFSYNWQHADPRMDILQRQVATCVEQSCRLPVETQFDLVEQFAYTIAGRTPPGQNLPVHEPAIAPPRLTEDWFC